MKRLNRWLLLIGICIVTTVTASAGTLWYNGDADGVNSFINQNSGGSDQVLFNDFNVPSPGWTVQSVWSNNIFTSGVPASTTANWQIWSGLGSTPVEVANGDAAATLTATGFNVLGSPEYMVLVSGLNVALAPGTYWLAVYPDNTNGGQAGNDTTSGANAVGSPAGNNGNMFVDFGAGPVGTYPIDTSAGIGGTVGSPTVPEPSTLPVLAILGAAGIVFTRSRRKVA